MSIVSTGVGDHPVIRCTGSCELSRGALYVSAPKHFFWRGQRDCHRHAVPVVPTPQYSSCALRDATGVIRSRLTWHAERGRSDSPCERPCAGRGRPLAASLAPSAAEGTRPPHVCRYALHQLALQIACARGVCVLARARARQNLTMKLPLPASIIHIPASATCRSHIPGTIAEPMLHWCHISARVLGMQCGSARNRQ